MAAKKEIKVEIEIPKGIEAEIKGGILTIKGKAGEVQKKLFSPSVDISKEDDKVIIRAAKPTKREQKLVRTFTAHINNMIMGSGEPFKYRLKICSGHFPMNVTVKGEELIVKNFFGEKIPRILKLKGSVSVKVEGDEIFVESPDKELAGQVAADIEQLVRRTKYDTRIFQDGIWIIEKAGMELK
jgi:large subunit ribosomal protein L6